LLNVASISIYKFGASLAPLNKNLGKTVDIINKIDGDSIEKFVKLTDAMKNLADVKSLELSNTNISKVTHEVVSTVKQASIPTKQTGQAAKRVQQKKISEKTVEKDNQLIAAINRLASIMENVNSSVSDNGEDLDRILSRLNKTIKVKQQDV